jgi:hypothetical protein
MNLLRLDDTTSISLHTFSKDAIPPYATLSHTWGRETEEVSFSDIKEKTGSTKVGYKKLLFCGHQAKADHLDYFWVDTCCIDKDSGPQLQRAINTMFYWYQNASRCYVYLADVTIYSRDGQRHVEWESAFRNSRWFTRGWTLQELLAPKVVQFYSYDQVRLGDKYTLQQQIIEITGITKEALQGQPLSSFTIEERFLWASKRNTTEDEDRAYCLLGIFDVFLPLIYGEGQSNAMRRLKREIKELASNQGQLNGELMLY